MISNILHIGITVTDLDRSIMFYRDIMGLTFQGEIVMDGPETELLFNRPGTKARVAYLNGSSEKYAPPIELIQFIGMEPDHQVTDLFRTSVSEICFMTDDIEADYRALTEKGVRFLSAPQHFDFSKDGFSKSKAVYFHDPDGIIIELMEPEKEIV